MRLARYWARDRAEATGPNGQSIPVTARGWSDDSIESARAVARDIARRTAARIASGEIQRGRYQYGERPLPEPIVREIQSGAASPAVITRNQYGALVLNAATLMFIDIDHEEKPAAKHTAGVVSGVLSLFGRKRATPQDAPPDPMVTGIQQVAKRNGLGVRVYKTAAGYRAVVTNVPFEAGDARAVAMLQEFGADKLYIRLCRMQQSFRARLTPKPWRCGVSTPPVSYPYESPDEEQQFREWKENYDAAAAGFSTCRFITTYGIARVEPAFAPLIDVHDRETKSASNLPLA